MRVIFPQLLPSDGERLVRVQLFLSELLLLLLLCTSELLSAHVVLYVSGVRVRPISSLF